MDLAHELLGELIAQTEAFGPRLVRPELLGFAELGLHLRIGRSQVDQLEQGTLVSAEFIAGLDAYQQNIAVACQGLGRDHSSAQQAVLRQWTAGVLPALAAACGDRSHVAGSQLVELHLPGGLRIYDALLGPVLERGKHNAAGQLASPHGFLDVLSSALAAERPNPQAHWLEASAQRSAGSRPEARCRLDSREWKAGAELLAADTTNWPGATPTFHSRWQFIYLQPHEEDEPVDAPAAKGSLLGRLFGRR